MPDYDSELQHLDALLAEDHGDVPVAAMHLALGSLRARRKQLVASPEAGLELDITREPAYGSGGELGLVGTILRELQESVSSIAQGLTSAVTARGMLPRELQNLVGLRVQAASPGSLRLRLAPVTKPDDQQTLFDAGPTTLEESLDRLFSILSPAAETASEASGPISLSDQILAVGPRAAAHIESLSRALVDGRAGLDFGWSSARLHRRVHFSWQRAAELRRELRATEPTKRTEVYTGRLVGGSLVRDTFELELEDHTVIAGKVAADLDSRLEQVGLGADCTARVEVREARTTSGETKQDYRLIELTE